jgi:hypothetical protein
MPFRNSVYSALAFGIAIVAVLQCTRKQPQQKETEEFPAFYERFHTDSIFQMSRIAFPLSGLPAADTADDFRWTADNWILHRPFDNSTGEFDRDVQVITDDLIVETISVRGLDIAMQRRFARMADGWNLIYYVEMQPVRQTR